MYSANYNEQKHRADAEAEWRRRKQAQRPTCQPAGFIAATKIKTPQEEGAASVPFDLWPAQRDVLSQMERERLLVILKARQLGISWCACGYVLWLCTQQAGKTVLLFSQGQLEANELIERISFMYYEHQDKRLSRLVRENTTELEWANGSTVKSLPATRKAGRSFSASLVIFDEFAFMLFGASLYAAAKPTTDDGGKLWIISSADGQGTPYHQFWEASKAGGNGFTSIFLPWQARPSRDADWRSRKLSEAYSDASEVLREYPENDIEAFTHAAGLVYDVWKDTPDGSGNVTEAADYMPDGGEIVLSIDDGYSGTFDRATGLYTANSHPRVFGLYQIRPNGTICRFNESYAVQMLSDQHIEQVQGMGYPEPEYAVVDSSAAELRGRLQAIGIGTYGGTHPVEEGIKEMRRRIAPDANGVRTFLVHPRCTHFRAEMVSYRYDDKGRPVKAFDHGLDEARMLCWHLRHEV